MLLISAKMITRFGTSGNPPNFFKSEYGKDRKNAVEWINSIGLNAYECLMTYGARTKEETARYIAEKSKQFDVSISVHAPYYIVFTSEKPDVFENSSKEMLKTLRLAEIMNSKKVIFHPGFGRDVQKVIRSLKLIEKDKPPKVKILPETTGKISQLGDLNDVLTICENTESLPCIDFAHLHARTLGTLKNEDSFRKIIVEIEKRLGTEVLRSLHCHFYPVEFTDKGEKIHRAVTEQNAFPQFKHFVPIIKEFKMNPTLISESRDTQDIGALQMKEMLK